MGFELLLEYGKTLLDNARAGSNIGKVSDKYPVKATPVDSAFSIWGLIYFQLFFLSIHLSDKSESGILLKQSFDLNREWLRYFMKEDLNAAYRTIRELQRTNQALVDSLPSNLTNLADVYNTWVKCATVLSKSIEERHVKNMIDNSNEHVLNFLEDIRDKPMRPSETLTLLWAANRIRAAAIHRERNPTFANDIRQNVLQILVTGLKSKFSW